MAEAASPVGGDADGGDGGGGGGGRGGHNRHSQQHNFGRTFKDKHHKSRNPSDSSGSDDDLWETTADGDDRDAREHSMIELMPDHVLVKIFSFLNVREKVRTELVCRRWLCLSRISWGFITSFVAADFPQLLKLRGFHASYATLLTNDLFPRILRRMKNPRTNLSSLEKLNTYSVPLGAFALKAIGDLCPNLKSLDLSGSEISMEGLQHISKGCKGLKRVTLMACVLHENAAWCLLKDCLQLTHLNLSDNPMILGDFFNLANSSLVSLDLSFCKKLKDSSLDQIVERCPLLQELDLSGCRALTFDSLRGLGKLNLRTLRMTRLIHIRDEVSWEPLFTGKTSLKEIDLSHNSCFQGMETLTAIIVNCLDLEILNLSSCYSLNDLPIFASAMLGLLSSLKLLNLSNIRFPQPFRLVELSSVWWNLEELYLIMTSYLSDEVLANIVNRCPVLRLLDCSGNLQLTHGFVDSYFALDAESQIRDPLTSLEVKCNRTAIFGRFGLTGFPGLASPITVQSWRFSWAVRNLPVIDPSIPGL